MAKQFQGKKYMDTVLYTGNGGEQTVGGLEFNPDLVWLKARGENYDHYLTDTVRGATKSLRSNTTAAEDTLTQGLTAFTSDGFTVGNEGQFNNPGRTMVAWAWDAGDTTETIAVGAYNSELYDQSQPWTSYYTTDGPEMNNPGSSFDGDTGTQSYILNGTATWTLPTAISVNSVEIYFNNGTNTDFFITEDGISYTEITGIEGAVGWRTVFTNGTFRGFRTTQSDATSTAASVKAMKIDGKLLVDQIDDSQVWSDDITGSSNGDPIDAFDGDLINTGWFPSPGASNTWTPSTPIEFSTLTVYGFKDSTPGSLVINGTDVTSQIGNSPVGAYTITGITSPITSVVNTSNGTGQNVFVSGIAIDGKLLIDAGKNLVPNVPSIETTVRASSETGFSIVSYSGNQSEGAHVAHGLENSPSLIMVKDRDSSQNWYVLAKTGTGTAASNYGVGYLNDTALFGDLSTNLFRTNSFNNTPPNSNTFELGSDAGSWTNSINQSGNKYTAYCWSEVEGYSRIGNYVGNNSSSNFVYTGFKPQWILIKRTDSAGYNWVIWDNARDSDDVFLANTTDIEQGGVPITAHPTGFEIETNDANINANNAQHIFMAFAENPMYRPRTVELEFADDQDLKEVLQGDTLTEYTSAGAGAGGTVSTVDRDNNKVTVLAGGANEFTTDGSRTMTKPVTTPSEYRWTWAAWVKRGEVDSINTLFDTGDDAVSSVQHAYLWFGVDNKLEFICNNGDISKKTARTFTDTSTWMHVHMTVDAIGGGGFHLYINGEEITDWDIDTDNIQGKSTSVNKTGTPQYIGFMGHISNNNYYHDGLIAEVHFVDGQVLTPDAFTKTNPGRYDQLVPKEYDGWHGTRGYHLHMNNVSTVSTLASDFSGNNDNWTATGINAGGHGVLETSEIIEHSGISELSGRFDVNGEEALVTYEANVDGVDYLYAQTCAVDSTLDYHRRPIGSDTWETLGSYTQTITNRATTYAAFVVLPAGEIYATVSKYSDNSGLWVYQHWKSDTAGSNFSVVRSGSSWAGGLAGYVRETGVMVFIDVSDGAVVSNSKYAISYNHGTTMSTIYTISLDGTRYWLGKTNSSGAFVVREGYQPRKTTTIGVCNPLSTTVTARTAPANVRDAYLSDDGIIFVFSSDTNQVYRSADNGVSWTTVWDDASSYPNNLLGMSHGKLWANWNDGTLASTDDADGTQWRFYDKNGQTTADTFVGNSSLSGLVNFGSYSYLRDESNLTFLDSSSLGDLEIGETLTQSDSAASGTVMEVNPRLRTVKTSFSDWTLGTYAVTADTTNSNTDLVVDTPNPYETDSGLGGEQRGNYATMNVYATYGSSSISNGGLEFNSTTGYGSSLSNITVNSGKWYWEFTKTDTNAGIGVGVALQTVDLTLDFPRFADGYAYIDTGNKANNNSYTGYGDSWTSGDVIGIAFDADAGTLTFYKNGVSQGEAFTGLTNGDYAMAVGDTSNSNTSSGTINFGQKPFQYPAPAGFKTLNANNIEDGLIIHGDEHMSTILYTGNGGTQTVEGLTFSPDLVWVKSRTTTNGHNLYDTLRGPNKYLSSSSDGAEGTATVELTAFNSDGFDVGSAAGVNQSNESYVAWCWNAGDSAPVTNSLGSVQSTVKANPSAGFSIVKWNTSADNQTVGHGLGVTPGLVIAKSLDSAKHWRVWSPELSSGHNLMLDRTDAETTVNPGLGGDGIASANSSVITMDGNGTGFTGDHIAYCWSEVEGYSKFGVYDLTHRNKKFIHTGFKPSWVMVKGAAFSSNWFIFDLTRNPHNPVDLTLKPNQNSSEVQETGLDMFELLDNGFIVHDIFGLDSSNFFYAAFGEMPFQYKPQ